MKIEILNVSDGEVFNYGVVLIYGAVDTPALDVSRTIYISQTDDLQVQAMDLRGNKFKHLVRLRPGENHFVFQYLNKMAQLTLIREIVQSDIQHVFKLFYIVCSDDQDGRFQSPEDQPHDLATAISRMKLGAELMQCFLGDSLACQGFLHKAIHFNQDDGDLLFRPKVEVLHSGLTIEQARAMSGQELWEFHGKELLKRGHLGEEMKCIAIMSATSYQNPGQIKPKSHQDTLDMTQGHAALGGGGLALFGSGCLYTWPDKIDQVQARFQDQTPVNWKKFMDDSGYRGTIGGCFATSLGAIIHEVGHCLDLEHTTDGIMARGFDDLDFYFTVIDRTTSTPIAQPCLSLTQTLSNSHGPLSGPEKISGKDLIDQYHLKLHLSKIKKLFGGAFWSGSGVLILNHHKWLNDYGKSQSSIFLSKENQIQSPKWPIQLVDVRDHNFFSTSYLEVDAHTLNLADLDRTYGSARQFLVINSIGDVLKIEKPT
ncbi:hypothetical protein TCAL_01220 [Tigriopus californicus]|uniref:Uncharacterized protein n=1 Tax=Tigriopus californicus TaxID=6832 RepID=A0A553NXK0_TIGCA|nr:uncharacterized protein LOC131886914 [Tigriopus californicus]TRY70163.1 hypothetical protein TCAL_01220 [Tigriopus californicus]|eukprot:TCALIF_01220-PA protein Name:"Similar to YIL108W Putative zinc metalloproteinase YIL108W (Saccharomyces cerevisiae (strain ATCC 204508 / S288c))" AED:0.03 eAED:0.00 QI:326/1/0.75/1/1/1/4/116/483